VNNSNIVQHFTLLKCEKLASLMVPTIVSNTISTYEVHILVDYLVLKELFNAFFNFILYMKHDNLIIFDVFM
jgi:hypothetical protein